jgi:cyclase
MRIILVVSVLLACGALAFADSTNTTERTVTQLAPNVYTIRHPDAPDGFPQSNTTIVIGERGVLVVDSCLLPSTAKQDIAQIRKWTNKPVLYVLNTHWHFDHTAGNATYAAAWPGIEFIAQHHTRKIIHDFNPGAMARYPGRADRFKKILAEGKTTDGKPLTDADRKDYEKALAGLAPVVEEFKSTTQLVPNIGFDREMTIDLGGTEVHLKFLGRGNTGGDTIAYLPKEMILATGDLVVHPVPYMFGGFPTEFPDTLDALARIDAAVIVPGHGELLRDKTYIYKLRDMMRAVNAEIDKQVGLGKTEQETIDAVAKNLDIAGWRKQFAGDSAEDASFFDNSFNAMVKAAYALMKAR